MPGPQVKNWPQYEKLRAKGFTKESAAKITNSASSSARQLARKRLTEKDRHGRHRS